MNNEFWRKHLRTRHKDWPLCGVCGWVIDPNALLDADGVRRWSTHPTCGEEDLPNRQNAVPDTQTGRARRRRAGET